MANNRMYLKNRRTGAEVCLAKFYPSTGWNASDDNGSGKNLVERIDAVLRANEPEKSAWGDNDWTIAYEHCANGEPGSGGEPPLSEAH